MGAWYDLGLAAGLAVAFGVAAAGVLPRGAALAAAVFGVALAFGVFDWDEAIAGALGGVLGGSGAGSIVAGALKRGGTRGGLALLLAGAGVVAAGLAFVPIAGYLEALVVPLLALRIRARAGSRYAGLRILAKD